MLKEFEFIDRYKRYLTPQQYRTLCGQCFAGDTVGAIKGLKKILERRKKKYAEKRTTC